MSEKTTQEADYWECKSCGVKVDDNSDRKVLPISMGAGVITFSRVPLWHRRKLRL